MDLIALLGAVAVAALALIAVGRLERRKRHRRAEALIHALTRLAGEVGANELSESRRAMLAVADWPRVLREVAAGRWPELERRVRELVERHLERVDREPGVFLEAMSSADRVPRWIDSGEELADIYLRAFAQGYDGVRFALEAVQRATTAAGKAAAWGLASEAAFGIESDDAKAHAEVVARAKTLADACDDETLSHCASDVAWLARELRDASPGAKEASQELMAALAGRLQSLREAAGASEATRTELDGALEWLRERRAPANRSAKRLMPRPDSRAARHDLTCVEPTLDRAALSQELARMGLLGGLDSPMLEAHEHLYASTAILLDAEELARITELVAAVERAAQHPAYVARALEDAPPIARHAVAARGVFFGYDFHLGEAGPKLIEVNTNAGGALLNVPLLRAQRPCCAEPRRPALEEPQLTQVEARLAAMFDEEWRLERGDAPLRSLAIVDASPTTQYLAPEFTLFRELFARRGLDAVICSPEELTRRDGGLWHRELRLDLVYNRLTDFYLEEPASQALREAYLAREVVVTPHPRAHALYAHKHNLVTLADQAFLASAGVDEPALRALRESVPECTTLTAANADALWAERKRWFFKPGRGYGSKAAYRGDKLTKGTWAEIVGKDYVAQRLVPPSERAVHVAGATTRLKLDVRAYAYAGEVQLLAARLYQGQTTNFRTPGGGFAPVHVAP